LTTPLIHQRSTQILNDMSKEKSLPTLRERWNQLIEVDTAYRIVNKYNKYVKFTAQKLSLWMFVPCNSKGEPMEKPEHRCQTNSCMCSQITLTKYSIRQREYEKALDACIFEGWEKGSGQTGMVLFYKGREYEMGTASLRELYTMKPMKFHKTIEDLITAKIPLTLKPNHAKELNL